MSLNQTNEDMYDELDNKRILLTRSIGDFKKEIKTNQSTIEEIAGHLLAEAEEFRKFSDDFNVLQQDFDDLGLAIKDLKAKKNSPEDQIAELQKQRRAVSRRKSKLNKQLQEKSTIMDGLEGTSEHLSQINEQLKVQITDSEKELKRVKKAMPQVGVAALKDELSDEVFEIPYDEFKEEFDAWSGPVEEGIVEILDVAQPVVKFILQTLYDRYMSIRGDLHPSRLKALEMNAKNSAKYYLTLIEAGVDEKIARKMMEKQFKPFFSIGKVINEFLEDGVEKLLKKLS